MIEYKDAIKLITNILQQHNLLYNKNTKSHNNI